MELRNPHGMGEWNGKWSDNSPVWTDDLKKFFNPNLQRQDGVFCMSYRSSVLSEIVDTNVSDSALDSRNKFEARSP